MNKLSQAQIKKFITFLEAHKHLVGFQGWKVLMKEAFCDGDNYAQCEANIYEQTLVIELNSSFMDLDEERQESILIHELVHGRIEAFKKVVDELTEYEEEKLANDLERGFFSFYKELKGEQK